MEWEQEQLRRSGHMHGGNVDEVAVKPIYKPAPSKHISHQALQTDTKASYSTCRNSVAHSRTCNRASYSKFIYTYYVTRYQYHRSYVPCKRA